MKLIQIAKRGADKTLTASHWLSATLKSGTTHNDKPGAIRVSIWLSETEGDDSRYRLDMTARDAEALRDFLSKYDFS